MMITFVSQCEKKALNRTRRVLDSFANRIGDNAWQTVITNEGLQAVKKLLRKTASKNTAVSCHWLRSASRSDLVWVVGNKRKFNQQGMVPVNMTTVQSTHRDDQADWHYLPLIQSLASIAALFHDWGKASARFQQKLEKGYTGNPSDALRHEWISCLLLKAFINGTDASSDVGWLSKLANGDIGEAQIKSGDLSGIESPLTDLPPIAKLVAWLILTHHRLPLPRPKHNTSTLLNDWRGEVVENIDKVFEYIKDDWGYKNEAVSENLQDCLRFPQGLLSNSKRWVTAIRRWSKKLLEQQTSIETIMEDGSFRCILHHARLCLMLADHYFSSLTLEESGKWQTTTGLIANTQSDRSPKQTLGQHLITKPDRSPKQKLDQHLVGVYEQAKRNVQKLPILEKTLPSSDNIDAIKQKSPAQYSWQDEAATKIADWTAEHKEQKSGFFAVNMASTGCGKTLANAKVMLALSENQASLRYILALGLRTLTLQTGDEYRQRIFQDEDGGDLAVLIGSKAIADLHRQKREQEEKYRMVEVMGSESQEILLDEDADILFNEDIPEQDRRELKTVLRNDKDHKFLYAPVLVCTIDHIMSATETTRGGRYILPCLRLMSSDLVIDEVDDFTGADSIAIGRLIHLAGMLGRKVMISSATIPPALAEGYFNCYREGWRLFAQTRNACQRIGCAWIDEFNTVVTDNQVSTEDANQQYADSHQQFIKKRIGRLSKQAPKRKANIIDCSINSQEDKQQENKQSDYFGRIAQEALAKHQKHHQVDKKTGCKVSFGVVRMANISPCVALTRFLLDYPCSADTTLRVMAYHSQQVLLLRHEQEKHLDAVLKRKEKPQESPAAFSDDTIRRHIDSAAKKQAAPSNILFIVVATPVEEVGRDHDFDWAIVEPSSYRSIIQLAGRVRRHRAGAVQEPNVGLLQYNWKTIQGGNKANTCYFSQPGYELSGKIKIDGEEHHAVCKTHDLKQLVDESLIRECLDVIPRINDSPPKEFRLAKLEHAVTAHWLQRYADEGPETLSGYIKGCWYLTALPQALNRFRQSGANIQLFRCFDDSDKSYFTDKDCDGKPIYTTKDNLANQDDAYGIEALELTAEQQQRLWLQRDYRSLLAAQAEREDMNLNRAALRYGELLIRKPDEVQAQLWYNDQLGLFKEAK